MSGSSSRVSLTVRRLTHLEPELLAELERSGRESLGEAALDHWMLPVVATCGLLYIGRAGEETVGSAQIIRCLDGEDLYMDGFYIRKPYRRRGYGTALLSEVKNLLAGEGFVRLLVTLDPGNEAGLRLYESTGFHEVDYLPDYYGKGLNRLLFAASLLAPGQE